jgi:hypothetical protein
MRQFTDSMANDALLTLSEKFPHFRVSLVYVCMGFYGVLVHTGNYSTPYVLMNTDDLVMYTNIWSNEY